MIVEQKSTDEISSSVLQSADKLGLPQANQFKVKI